MSVVFNKGDLTNNFVTQAGGYAASAPALAGAVVAQLDGLRGGEPALEHDTPSIDV